MLIGRVKERALLEEMLDADESKFVAVYGRRRVGKTYLVREAIGDGFAFQHAGVYGGSRAEQLFEFTSSLKSYGLGEAPEPSNWLQAFELLKELIRNSRMPRKVLFIDELSWMDTPKSDLVMALEHFWNSWASARKDIVLIVCSSVTSWMLNEVIHNKGGLYNRLSLRIHLEPFSLSECEEYSRAHGLAFTRYQLLEAYMILGGVPYYWTFLRRGLSLSQNIDYMFFSAHPPMEGEYEHLFSSLFKHPEPYVRIVECLCGRKAGMTRNKIITTTGMPGSGTLTKRLEELENCGFIRSYSGFGKRKKDALYQLVDPFVLFHHQFLQNPPTDENYWTNQLNTPRRNAWSGLAFERVCLRHVGAIKRALGISGVLSDVCSWNCEADEERGLVGSQVDLVIDRSDNVVNLVEMKFAGGPYAISKKTDADLRRKRSDFMLSTKTRSSVHLTMVTPYGLVPNSYAGNIQSQVTGDDLFSAS